MRDFYKIVLVAFCIYFFSWLFVFTTGINEFAMQSEDTIPAMFIPITILRHGTLYADQYYSFIIKKYPHPDDKKYIKGLTPYYFRKIIDGDAVHYVSAFPIMAGVLAIPVFLLPIVFGTPLSFDTIVFLSHIASALIVALSGGVLFLLLNYHFFCGRKKSLILTIIYLFGTVNYALISQALWQHGVVELFILLGLLFLYKAFESNLSRVHRSYYLLMSAIALGFALIARPTTLIPIFFIYLLLISKSFDLESNLSFDYLTKKLGLKTIISFFLRRSVASSQNLKTRDLFDSKIKNMSGIENLVCFTVGFSIPLGFFYWYNQSFYKSIVNQGYSDQLLVNWLSRFPEGFLGIWLSPSKGILIYSPVFIFAFIGLWLVTRAGKWRKNFDYIAFMSIVLLYTLVMGKWKHWYGGWSFGYRMASDVIPFLILLLVPIMKNQLSARVRWCFLLMIVLSILMELHGIAFFDGVWHATFDRGFVNTAWLWSISNSEFIFNCRRVLAKLFL